ncbi:ABC transporter substrate-binding protein [Limnohabitans sp. Hippo3]|uniref:ABC transporter substrate-binding protein n=1 Tax=Limnohabitans sp. Hippo3 TaxID=1597956 RepID=UPI000D356660|nr:helical backbone metal receptor [Limnohabitans sp. Hippo3]PUE43496.1 ABC transporter substrate-binding protein [Limnohabitans sp. Hippo3]
MRDPRSFWWIGLLLCSALAQAVTVRDDRQQDIVITKPPERIVSLLPSLTETVCALGQCHKLVGLDRYSNWPESVRQLPRMGGGLDPSMEAVVALRPDLVLMATSARGAERFQALGLTVLVLEPRTHADAQRVLHTVAQALGVPKAQSDAVWRQIDAGVVAAAQSLPSHAKGQKIYVEVSPAPYGASESSFIGETLARLGMRNILPASLGPFPKINPEFVVRAQPDVIMAGDSSRANMAQRPGWSQLKAFQSGKVCAFSSEESDMLVRAGPRIAEGARLMVQCLQRTAGDKP